jgi:hypothetical protein
LGELAAALEKTRSWGEALRVARQRVELDSGPRARFALAKLERATGHRDRAVALLSALTGDDTVGADARELLRNLTGSARVALRD